MVVTFSNHPQYIETVARAEIAGDQALCMFGPKRQLLKLAEECNELARAVVRFKDKDDIDGWLNLKEEMIDVLVMLNQLIPEFMTDYQFIYLMNFKTTKLINILEREKSNEACVSTTQRTSSPPGESVL